MNANMNTYGQTRRCRAFDPYVHANHKGTGSACRFELHPAHGESAGSIFMEIAMQNSVGGVPGHEFPTFDWANKIVVKFDRTDLSQILQVLNGMKEEIAAGKGLFHRTARANTIIRFSHQIDPKPAYALSISRKTSDGDLKNAWFTFDVDEAFTLRLALEQSMMYVCLGIPEVIERRASRPQQFQTPQQPVYAQPAPVAAPSMPERVDLEPVLKVSGDNF